MTDMNEKFHLDTAALRRQAEDVARRDAVQSPENTGNLSPEARHVIHELRVHQIELEMQNEELRKTHEELDATRQRYFDLFNLAPVGYITVCEKGLILEANLTAVRMLGIVRSSMVTQALSRFVFKQDQNTYYLHRKHLLESDVQQSCELRMVKKDGTVFWALLQGISAQDDDGAPLCRLVMSDITERKLAELALQTFSTVVEQSPVAVVITDLEGDIQYANPFYTKVSGYSFEELKGQNSRILKSGEFSPESYRELWNTILAGDVWRGEFPNRKKNGDLYYEQASIAPLKDAQGVIMNFIGIKEDITQKKRAEEEKMLLQSQVIQSGKMESLGVLAGGIAHEINTPLQFLAFNLRFLKKTYPRLIQGVMPDLSPEPVQGMGAEPLDQTRAWKETLQVVEESIEGVEQVAQIVGAMKEFSRSGSSQPLPIDIVSAHAFLECPARAC